MPPAVQAGIAAMPAWKREVEGRLDALIVRTLPGVRKGVKWSRRPGDALGAVPLRGRCQ